MAEQVTYKGDRVGAVEDRPHGRKVYVTERDKDTWVRKYNGFGITDRVLGKMMGVVDMIEVHYKKANGDVEIYETTPQHWITEGQKDELGEFEPQYFLPANDFQEVRKR